MFYTKTLIALGVFVMILPLIFSLYFNSLSPERKQQLNESYQQSLTEARQQGREDDRGSYREPSACDIHGQIANVIIEGYTRYPEEARKPRCYETSLDKNSDGTYTMTGFVYAKNAFGVEGRLNYSVKLRFLGGSPSDISNWKNIGEPIISEY